MARYIELDALVEEIEKRISRNKKRKEWEDIPEKRHQLIIEGQLLGELKHFLDTIEVKEEDLKEEPNKCMYSKDNYTNEDRKALCDGCEEECKYAQKKESVSERFAFKAIPRLLEMIEPTDRAKSYTVKLADALEVEGYSTDAKIVRESLKIMNGDKVPMATMDGEPVSEKKCIFTKDNYTDEDRKILCEDCKEKCEYSKKEEPVSKELEEAASKYAHSITCSVAGSNIRLRGCNVIGRGFKAGAEWQFEQFEKNRLAACDRQTEEDAGVERDFVMGIIECEHRQPTFDDAIKYGMRLQKEQIKEALLSEILPYFMHGGEADEVVAKLDEVLNQKK